MASKVKVAVKEKKEEAAPEKDAPDTPDTPLPLLDLTDAAVRKMIKAAKKRGYVTHDQVNAVLPSEEFTSDQIEDVFAMLSEMGINVVENEEAEAEEDDKDDGGGGGDEDEGEGGDLVESGRSTPAETKRSEPGERTDDPVRMYLREMGSVELLSREGEIAIAKRIEAGREAMIAGLCESPLTFQAIIIWRDELNEGKVFLRDIIDLEATYAGPDAKNAPAMAGGGGVDDAPPQTAAPATAPVAPTPFRPKAQAQPDEPEPVEPPEGELDEEDLENSMSLAAIEAELKPKVLETFDNVADAYKRLRRLQDQDIENRLKNQSLSPAQERKYK
jgi:RNA polymerase primary sigma factor